MEVEIKTVNGEEYYPDVIEIKPYKIDGFTDFISLIDSEKYSLKHRIIKNIDIIEITIIDNN